MNSDECIFFCSTMTGETTKMTLFQGELSGVVEKVGAGGGEWR